MQDETTKEWSPQEMANFVKTVLNNDQYRSKIIENDIKRSNLFDKNDDQLHNLFEKIIGIKAWGKRDDIISALKPFLHKQEGL